MKTVRYERRAVRFLARNPNRSGRIREKIAQYAADPASLAPNVEKLQGRAGYRLRVGAIRVLFDETDTEIIVLDIGPRGSIYR
jgi:mRNA interferase RelE/StbE